MLPSIKISLPVIFVVWCVAACVALGPAMLAYPAMWGAVAATFFFLDRFLKREPSEVAADAGLPASS